MGVEVGDTPRIATFTLIVNYDGALDPGDVIDACRELQEKARELGSIERARVSLVANEFELS